MSDISIPGVSSKYKTEETVAKLVKAESLKLDKLQKELDAFKSQKQVWLDLSRNMTSLRNTSRALYSFETPFNERAATSSNTDSLTAVASREAVEANHTVQVLKIASPDRFVSSPLDPDQTIAAGTYEFVIGKDSVKMTYQGGTAKDFAQNLSRRADGILKASVVKTTDENSVLLIEGVKPGAANRIQFKEQALDMAVKLGILEKEKGSVFDLSPLDKLKVLKANESVNITLPSSMPRDPEFMLGFKAKLTALDASSWTPPAKPNGPQLPPGTEAAIGTVKTRDIQSDFDLPPYEVPGPPPVVEDNSVVFGVRGTELIPLAQAKEATDLVDVNVKLSDLATFDSLVVKNNNTYKTLSISDLRIYDPRSRGDYKPVNPLASAQDATIKVDGVDYSRASNSIDDIIPGVTLKPLSPSEKSFQLKVEPDRKVIKDKLIELVANYNNVMRNLNVLTARKDSSDVVEELDFLPKEERDVLQKRVGMYQGDTTLLLVKSKMQSITMNPYETVDGKNLSVLSQLGISTNASGTGTQGVQTSSLRGYLEINEKVLDKALLDHFAAAKEIFGRDSDKDLLVDNGVAYQLDNYIRPYTQTGGILAGKSNTSDTLIKGKQTEISKFQDYLKKYEQELKEKYGRMEASLSTLESSSREIQGLNKNN